MCVFIAVSVAGYRGDLALPFRERRLVAEPVTAEFGAPLPVDGSTLSVSDGHCEDLATRGARVTLLASDYDSSFRVTGSARLALGEFVSSGGVFPQNVFVTIDI
jgi:hypothetical protein